MEKKVQVKTLEASKMANELKIMKLNDEIKRIELSIKQQEEAINKLNNEIGESNE